MVYVPGHPVEISPKSNTRFKSLCYFRVGGDTRSLFSPVSSWKWTTWQTLSLWTQHQSVGCGRTKRKVTIVKTSKLVTVLLVVRRNNRYVSPDTWCQCGGKRARGRGRGGWRHGDTSAADNGGKVTDRLHTYSIGWTAATFYFRCRLIHFIQIWVFNLDTLCWGEELKLEEICVVSVPQSRDGQRLPAGQPTVSDE